MSTNKSCVLFLAFWATFAFSLVAGANDLFVFVEEYADCPIVCTSETKANIGGTIIQCPPGKVCNKECKGGDSKKIEM